jgi:dTDP-3-amino-3,4,6-trideoxy-alpha-D-glucose transaminase
VRDHGAQKKYLHAEVGYNSRLDELQAAALRVKLRRLTAWNRRRQRLAARYHAGLAGLGLQLPGVRPGAVHVFHQYILRTPLRDDLRSHLAERGIETAVHYPLPLHRQPALAHLPSRRRRFPVAEKAARELLCLPISPELSDRDQARVIAAVREFMHRT